MEKQSNDWISVKEQLPDVEAPVIGLCNILDLQIALIVSREVADGEYYWVAINQNDPDYDNAIDVTHWQPLPQPPEDKEPQAEATSHEKKPIPLIRDRFIVPCMILSWNKI